MPMIRLPAIARPHYPLQRPPRHRGSMSHAVQIRRISMVLSLTLLAACADRGLVGPPARPAFDLGGIADPDTGDLVLYPSDAVFTDDPAERSGAGASISFATAAAMPTIRIGVVQSSSTVLLGSTADYTIRDKANGVTVMSGT